MAFGDIIAANISSDGYSMYVTVEGMGDSENDTTYGNYATKYNFGTLGSGISTMRVRAVDFGYVDGVLQDNVIRNLEVPKVTRKAYPDTNVIDEQNVGGNLVVRVPLSETIYADTGATGSGDQILLSVDAGWVSPVAGGTSNAVVDLVVTNNTTRDYPAIIGQWCWSTLRGGWRRVEDNFNIAFKARHGFGIDKVTLVASGRTSLSEISVDRTTQSPVAENNGLYHQSYIAEIPIAPFDQGEIIDLQAIAYPKIGNAAIVLDTDSDNTIEGRIKGKTTCHMVCDKTGDLVLNRFAVVNKATGNNSTGVVGSIEDARANMFADQGEALNAGAYIVYVQNAGTPLLVAGWGNTPDTDFYLVITEDPISPGVVLAANTPSDDNYRRNLLCYEDIGISYDGTAGAGWLDGEGLNRQLLFRNVEFDWTSSPTVGLGLASQGCWFIGCSQMDNQNLGNFASSKLAYSITGCSEDRADSGFGTGAAFTFVGNSSADGSLAFFSKADSNPSPSQDNLLIEQNRALGMVANGTNTAFVFLEKQAVGTSIMGNVVECKTITSSGPMMWLWGDGNETPCENILLGNNTVVGERCNLFYQDSGTAFVLRKDIFIIANAFRSYNIKSDNFAANPNGNRTGNHETEYGVNCRDNMYDGSAASSFVGEYPGLRSTFELNGTTNIYGEMGYTDEQSSDGGGNGGGNYMPSIVSILTTRNSVDPFLEHDLNGSPNIGNIGAVQIGAGPPPAPPGRVIFDLQDGNDPLNTSPYSGTFFYYVIDEVGIVRHSGQATADGVSPTIVDSTNIPVNSQLWCAAVDLPSGKIRGELLTSTEAPT